MARIVKKVQQEYFEAIVDGRKTYEVRLADFECDPGDTLVLAEQKQGTAELTGREMECEVLFNLNTKAVERWYSPDETQKHRL